VRSASVDAVARWIENLRVLLAWIVIDRYTDAGWTLADSAGSK
jgi:hypothetical protein